MSETVLFMGWNNPARGREAIANEIFSSMINYLQKSQTNKAIERFEPVFLHPHGGDLNGFFLIRGTRDQIQKLRFNEEFLNLVTQADINVDGLGLTEGWVDQGVAEQLARWQKHIPAK